MSNAFKYNVFETENLKKRLNLKPQDETKNQNNKIEN